jgi:cob(I)alamin adenosyltransferase
MRLTKITTRTDDDGTTGLADGSCISKDSPRIEAGEKYSEALKRLTRNA